MTVFSYQIALNEQDMLALNKHHMRYASEGKKTILTIRLLYLLIVFVMCVLYFTLESDRIARLIVTIAMLILAVVFWFTVPKTLLKSTLRRYRKQPKPSASQITIDFDNQIIHGTEENAETTLAFAGILNFYEGEEAYYFYIEPSRAIILPFRAFHSTEEFVQFKKLAHDAFANQNRVSSKGK